MRQAVATAVLFVGLVGTSALGQNEPQIQKFANWIVENQSELAKYRWTERFALEDEGVPSTTRLFRVRFDADGLLSRRRLGIEVGRDAADGPLSRRIERDDETRATENDLPVELLGRVESYTSMPPGRAQAVYSRAVSVDESDTISAGRDEVTSGSIAANPDGTEWTTRRQDRWHLRIEDALNPGDRLDLWVDSETLRLRRLVIRTSLNEIPVSVTTEFTDLADGPTYPARSIIETTSDGRALLIQSESFDFVRTGSR